MGSDNVPVRIYTPKTPNFGENKEKPGVFIFIHGGGWAIYNIDSHEAITVHIAAKSGYTVISIEYPLAPEHRYPAAPNACESVVRYVMENHEKLNIDKNRIVVGGDSAGGNLAAVMALKLRDTPLTNDVKLRAQVLIYPAVDVNLLTETARKYGPSTLLSPQLLWWFWNHYLPLNHTGIDPYITPLRAQSLAHLPETYMAVCEYDLLRSEDEAYSRRLGEEGVKVEHRLMKGCYHGMIQVIEGPAKIEIAVRELERIIQWVKGL
eukprot:comp23661_c0_seq1/m.40446 comp23661_c0_seq1/g.40446  ORF comp23661_c0_seq1/g.40446 comp23661_c0_seq1/m.40446 type:complete len:264 (-) comp23661_c0_seq1:225-1016(-)